MNEQTQIIESKFLYNIQYVITLLFVICGSGIIVSWINTGQNNIVGLSVIIFSLLFIFFCELALFNHKDSNGNDLFWGQLLKNGSSLFIIICGLSWYLSLNVTFNDYIINNELPDSWYTFSTIIKGILFIYILQLYVYVDNIQNNLKKIYTGFESYISTFIGILLFILISIQYVIVTFYRTDG